MATPVCLSLRLVIADFWKVGLNLLLPAFVGQDTHHIDGQAQFRGDSHDQGAFAWD